MLDFPGFITRDSKTHHILVGDESVVLSAKENHSAIPDISNRALKIMGKYFIDTNGEAE